MLHINPKRTPLTLFSRSYNPLNTTPCVTHSRAKGAKVYSEIETIKWLDQMMIFFFANPSYNQSLNTQGRGPMYNTTYT